MARPKRVVEWCADPRGVELMMKTQVVNQAYFFMQQLSRTDTIAPFEVFSEIIRSIGLFWTFKGEEKLNKVPMYNHTDIGSCFAIAIDILRKLISILDVQSYVRRPFTAVHGRMEVDLDSEWLTRSRKLYVQIRGAGNYAEVIQVMGGIKACAPSHFAQVLQKRIQAVQLKWLRQPPGSLPASEECVYAEVVQEGRFWPGVEKELALAVGTSEELPYQFELFVE